MKKITRWLFILLFSTLPLTAQAEIDLEARVAAFFPAVSRFTTIYGNCMPCYELEATIHFCDLNVFGNLGFISKRGRSDFLHHATQISIANGSFGVKLPYKISDDCLIYGGIGPSFGSVFVHNHIESSHKRSTHFAMGAVIKTGVCYSITCNLFFNLFFDYLYQSCFHNHLNVGGSKLGAGVGYRF